MNSRANWKVLGYVLALFVAGAVSGSLVTYPLSKHSKPAPPRPGEIIWERLKSRLNLTAEQQDKIKPLVEKAGEQMKECRDGVVVRFHQINEDLSAKMIPMLTPEQREKLQQMEKEPPHRDRDSRRPPHGPSNENNGSMPPH